MIAITGATGQLGHYVIESLMKTVPASQIVAIVRNPAKAQALAAQGITVRQADYGDEAALTSALQGVEKLLLISSSEVGQRAPQHRNVINAAKAAGVISEAGHEGKVYELAGDSAWTLTQLAAELTKQSGKQVTYQNLSEADFAAALKSVGLPDGLADMLADSDVGASKGGLFDDSKTLSKLIGRPTTTLAESVSHLFNVNN
ncbi:TPA: NmrA family NAD(P)-binding protein [Escherichia coli]|nr:NmrA family NAD(P)-binding protein [Escherichia coli]